MTQPGRNRPCTCDACERDRRSFVGAPEDPGAERTVLGGILLDNRVMAEVQAALNPSDFHGAGTRVVYGAMLSLAGKQRPIDYQTLDEELKANPAIGSSGPMPMIAEYEAGVPSMESARHAVLRVKEMAIRRNLMAAAQEMIYSAQDRARDLSELLQASDRDLFAVSQGMQSEDDLPSFRAQLIRQFQTMLERSRNPSEVSGLRTGFADIDKMTGGLRPGQLTVIAGRPGHRKSLLAAHIALHAADLSSKPVALFSLEMKAEEMLDRYIAGAAHVSLGKVQSGRIGADREALNSGSGLLLEIANRTNIYIFDRSPMTTHYMHARCRQIAARDSALGLVVLDYAQLLDSNPHNDRGQSREREVARISRACKLLAMEMQVPVIILSQCNREMEKGDNKRPTLASLRESGALEQDADIVMGVHCADKQEQNSPDANVMEVLFLKQRNGRTGTIGLALFAEEMRLADLAKGTVFGLERESRERDASSARGGRR